MSTNICVICAWRATCQKKFSVSGRDVTCADFSKDISIQAETTEEEKKTEDVKSEEK
jgi:hypothetical protein